MIGGYTEIISLAGLENASTELIQAWIALSGLNLVNELAVLIRHDVRLTLVVARLEDIHINWHITISHVEDEIRQARTLPVKSKFEPLEPFQHRRIPVLIR